MVEFPENSIGLIDHAKASAMVPWCGGAVVPGWLHLSSEICTTGFLAGYFNLLQVTLQIHLHLNTDPDAGAKNHCTMAWCQCCSPRPYPGALSAHLERTPAWPRGCERCIDAAKPGTTGTTGTCFSVALMQPLEVVWIHTKICNRTD